MIVVSRSIGNWVSVDLCLAVRLITYLVTTAHSLEMLACDLPSEHHPLSGPFFFFCLRFEVCDVTVLNTELNEL